MKNLLCACVVVLLCNGFCPKRVNAGFWATHKGAGIIDFGRTTSRSPQSGAINGNLSASGFRTNGNVEDFSGAFSQFPTNTEVMPGTLNLLSEPNSNIGRTINIGSAQWGSFVGTVTSESSNGSTSETSGPSAFRRFVFTGNYIAGSDGYFLGGPGAMIGSTFTITFTRTETNVGTVGSVNARWILNTLSATPVPEPTSTAIFGAGLVGFAVRRLRKHRS